MLLGLAPDTLHQRELDFQNEDGAPDRGALMATLDGINMRYRRATVLMASAGLAGDARTWSMKQERRTPAYTKCWKDMPVARA